MKKLTIIILGIIILATTAFFLFQPQPIGTGTRTKVVYLDRDNDFTGNNTFTATTTLENGFVSTSTPTQAGQIVGLDKDGKLPAVDGSNLTNISPVYEQTIGYLVSTITTNASTLKLTSNLDGSILIGITYASGQVINIYRFEKDASGQYFRTHTVNTGLYANNPLYFSSAIVGNYIYIACTETFSNKTVRRYNLADLTGEQSITISGTAASTPNACFSDGTDLYIRDSTNVFIKFTISGTTITNTGSITYTSAGNVIGAICDGTSVFLTENGTTASIYKYALTGGAPIGSRTMTLLSTLPNVSARNIVINKSGYLAMSTGYTTESYTTVIGSNFYLKPFVSF